jgi:hypothetical protein
MYRPQPLYSTALCGASLMRAVRPLSKERRRPAADDTGR